MIAVCLVLGVAALAPEQGPYAFVSETRGGAFVDAKGAALEAAHIYAFADVTVVLHADGARLFDTKTKRKLGDVKDGEHRGERGDDGLLVFRRASVSGEETRYIDKRGKLVRKIARGCEPYFEKRAACVWRVPLGSDATTATPRASASPAASASMGGYVDEKGAVVIEPRFHVWDRFREGVALVKVARATQAGPTGAIAGGEPELVAMFIDGKGAQRFGAHYREAEAFSEGRAFVVSDDARGYIDENGKLVISLPDETGDAFSSGVAVVRGPKGERVVDRSGAQRLRLPPPFRVFDRFIDGRAQLISSTNLSHLEEDATATLALDGTVTDVPEVWLAPPPWPASLGKPPTALVVPKNDEYLRAGRMAMRARNPEECADAAASMIAVSRGGHPDAWLATERCARAANDEARAKDARDAFLVVSSFDPAVKRTRDAWAALGGRIPR